MINPNLINQSQELFVMWKWSPGVGTVWFCEF